MHNLATNLRSRYLYIVPYRAHEFEDVYTYKANKQDADDIVGLILYMYLTTCLSDWFLAYCGKLANDMPTHMVVLNCQIYKHIE